MNTFGVSAPLKELQKKFGVGPEEAVAPAKKLKLLAESFQVSSQ